MSVPPTTPQDAHAAIAVLLVVAAVLCVFYWRMALKIIVIVTIILVIYGTVTGVHDVKSLLTLHHHG